MMLRVTLLAALLALGVSADQVKQANLRQLANGNGGGNNGNGGGKNGNGSGNNGNGGGNLKKLTQPCTLMLREIDFVDKADDFAWDCEIDPIDNKGKSGKIVELDIKFKKNQKVKDAAGLLDSGVSTLLTVVNDNLFESGVTTLFSDNLVVNNKSGKATVMGNPSFGRKVQGNNGNGISRGRKLQVTGIKTVLAVMVIAGEGTTNTFTEAHLSDSIFGNGNDPFNLASGYHTCSGGALTFNKAPDRSSSASNISDGVVTLTLSETPSQGDTVMRNAITDKLESQFGVDHSELADYIMMCLPPGTMSGIAYAYIYGWMSVYSDRWCTYPSGQMHEIGHNLGLAHSNENGNTYQDQTGMMGYSYGVDDGPVMCFNNAKNYQLGWYDDRQQTALPLASPTLTRLIGVADYASAPASSNGNVVLKVEGHNLDYYVGFNHKDGINSGTVEDGNKVTIQSRTGTGYGESNKVASLSAGQSFQISDFGGSGNRPVFIEVETMNLAAGTLAYADVVVYQEGTSNCMSDDDCDDNIQCTINTCSNGICANDDSSCPSPNLFMNLRTDNYPSETSWTIVDNCNGNSAVMSGSGYTVHNTMFRSGVVAPSSQYTLTINDTYGDGICCNYGQGSFLVTYDGDNVASGGAFDSEKVITWGSCNAPITSSPVAPMPTIEPTFEPVTLTPTPEPTTSAPVTPAPSQEPTHAPVTAAPSFPCEISYKLDLLTDSRGSETIWEIVFDSDPTIVVASGGSYASSTAVSEMGCIPDDCYHFKIMDSGGNGMCCGFGEGSYSLSVGGNLVAAGGQFGNKEKSLFGTCKPM